MASVNETLCMVCFLIRYYYWFLSKSILEVESLNKHSETYFRTEKSGKIKPLHQALFIFYIFYFERVTTLLCIRPTM